MAEAKTLQGGCLCGKVRFTAAPPEQHIGACHCEMCRRWTGGPFLGVRCHDTVNVTSGDDQLQAYTSSEWGERLFCKSCGTSLFWRLRDGSHTEVAFGAFDDPSPFYLHTEVFIDKKPKGYRFADETNKMTGAELMEMMQQKAPEAAKAN